MTLLLVLDDAHMGNALFMKAFGQSIKTVKTSRIVILHASDRHTESLMQTGMFRADAAVRAARETNRKLVTWLADYGLSCIGMHGDQRRLFTRRKDRLDVDRSKLESYAPESVWLVSTLTCDENGRILSENLSEMARFLEIHLPVDEVVLFSATQADPIIKPDDSAHLEWAQRIDFIDQIPLEFRDYNHPVVLGGTTALALLEQGKPVLRIR